MFSNDRSHIRIYTISVFVGETRVSGSGVVEGERGGTPFPHFFHTKQNSCKIALFATVFTSISRRSPTSRSPISFFRTTPLISTKQGNSGDTGTNNRPI